MSIKVFFESDALPLVKTLNRECFIQRNCVRSQGFLENRLAGFVSGDNERFTDSITTNEFRKPRITQRDVGKLSRVIATDEASRIRECLMESHGVDDLIASVVIHSRKQPLGSVFQRHDNASEPTPAAIGELLHILGVDSLLGEEVLRSEERGGVRAHQADAKNHPVAQF